VSIDEKSVYEYCGMARELLKPLVCDTSEVLNERIDEGKNVLLEGRRGHCSTLITARTPL